MIYSPEYKDSLLRRMLPPQTMNPLLKLPRKKVFLNKLFVIGVTRLERRGMLPRELMPGLMTGVPRINS